MLIRVKNYLKTRRAIKSDCLKFSDYIKKGYYLLTPNKRFFCFQKVSFFKWISRVKFAYSFKGHGEIDSFMIISGTEKINFITKTVVISKFLKADTKIGLIENRVGAYLPKLLLPHSEYLRFDLAKKEIVTSYVPGKFYVDKDHTKKLMDFIVQKGLESVVVRSGKNKDCLLFVQHGDAYGNNIIWQDDNSFKCIDNENVGLYPAFYDAFLLAAINSRNVEDFIRFNKQYYCSYEIFCEKNNILFSSFFDRYISYFIFFRMMSYSPEQRANYHRPFAFMNDKKFKDIFPEAYRVLVTISENRKIPELEVIYKESGHCDE